MSIFPRLRPLRRRGLALATVLILLPICLMLMFGYVDKVLWSTRGSIKERGRTQTFHMAEAGLVLAYDAFQANNFCGVTHVWQNGRLVPCSDPAQRLVVNPAHTAGGLTLTRATGGADEGWFVWNWHPGDPADLTFGDGTDTEQIAFRVYPATPATAGLASNGRWQTGSQWRIDCRASIGGMKSTHTTVGVVSNNVRYALFSAGDLNDLTKADPVTVTGKIHANGNLYLLPRVMNNSTPPMNVTGVKLGISKTIRNVWWPVRINPAGDGGPIDCALDAEEVEVAGRIYRNDDLYGEGSVNRNSEIDLSRGNVSIKANGTVRFLPYQAGNAEPVDLGALSANAWGDKVRDSTNGARRQESFDTRTIGRGGYYEHQAGLGGYVLSHANHGYPWVQVKQFYNNSEDRLVTVYDVDVGALAAAWPSNGLIYSAGPVRLFNAARLAGPLTVVSPATIYTRGQFNVDPVKPPDFPRVTTPPTDADGRKPAALITSDRIYHLSDSWADTTAPAPPQKTAVRGDSPEDIANKLHDQFPPPAQVNNVAPYGVPDASGDTYLVINADLVDGAPSLQELNWVPAYYGRSNPYFANLYYGGPMPYHSRRWQAAINCAAQSDTLLEEFHEMQVDTAHPSTWFTSSFAPSRSEIINPDQQNWVGKAPVSLVRTGSIMHLQCARMGDFTLHPPVWDEDQANSQVTPWLVKSYYTPWKRYYNSEPMFNSPDALNLPAFAPNVSTRQSWLVSE